MLAPRIESVIAEKKGEVILAKVDIDENTELALDYEVIVTAVEKNTSFFNVRSSLALHYK
jgi:hypothetical protein